MRVAYPGISRRISYLDSLLRKQAVFRGIWFVGSSLPRQVGCQGWVTTPYPVPFKEAGIEASKPGTDIARNSGVLQGPFVLMALN